ncbi:hypothetical protein D9M72_205560 [compost metagenome]
MPGVRLPPALNRLIAVRSVHSVNQPWPMPYSVPPNLNAELFGTRARPASATLVSTRSPGVSRYIAESPGTSTMPALPTPMVGVKGSMGRVSFTSPSWPGSENAYLR